MMTLNNQSQLNVDNNVSALTLNNNVSVAGMTDQHTDSQILLDALP